MRTCRKNKAGTRHKDRDRQFRYLVRMRRLYRTRGWPVISVDTKKKEWVGDFKNPGRTWRREDREVLDHDFPSWALGRAIPYGIYDLAYDDGYWSSSGRRTRRRRSRWRPSAAGGWRSVVWRYSGSGGC